MRRLALIALVLGTLGCVFPSSAQVVLPSGITCCDEQTIRLAMTEEALARIVARGEADRRELADYLTEAAYEKIRRRLPAGNAEERLDFLRGVLEQPEPDAVCGEFQVLVGRFVLGMTLEIGQTLQDEYDLAMAAKEKIERLLATLERAPAIAEEELGRVLFQADISDRELRRLRALEGRWQTVRVAAHPFDEFSALRRNVGGRAADPDQRMVFTLAERYRGRFPFLDEFLEKYRAAASGFREAARRLNALLSASGL